MSRGNPNWTRKYGEPTKVVRLPASLADEILEQLKADTPTGEVLQQLASDHKAKLTIVQAIAQIMRIAEKPLTVAEIYEQIIENNLYEFKADDPVQVVRSQLRRHCEGLDFPSALPNKYFVIVKDGKYWLKDSLLQEPRKADKKSSELEKLKASEEELLKKLEEIYSKYLINFRDRVIQQILRLDNYEFELFSKKLLEAFKFQNIEITEKYEDGGVKGHGDLKFGVDFLKFAFRFKRIKIEPSDVNEFRGSIDGEFRQGMFFTLSEFTDKAKETARKPGAIPITLIDGSLIVERMIDERLGIEKIKSFSTYISILDDIASTIAAGNR
ncbi:restriction endonuclease [Trichocoleus sp. ST-U3]|uniref:restriction endonuclease n=1 Tax=Coleofasciculus sp. FACHB-542 TaxID=2692787 RepID=UPI00168914C3|nr:restriction endonuclease [Coleofasciculus sp. FACHB-542]